MNNAVRRWGIIPTLALCVALGSGAAGAERTWDEQCEAEREHRVTPVVEVFKATRDAVVNISSTQMVTRRDRGLPFPDIDEFFERFFDPRPRREMQRRSIGSGFVIHPEGYIVTNAHVVARAVDCRVTFADGREYEAEIVASDSSRDLAILRVNAGESLPTVTLGRSDDLMTGETVIAIGNPLGFQHTVTSGVISATDRDLHFPDDLVLCGLIQTDASINPGNSGGPLLNVLGQLIGINTAIRGDAQNIGFAIPVDQLRSELPELLDIERQHRLVTGIRVDTLSRPMVLSVDDDSPGDRAGIEAGDVLLSIDGRDVSEGIDYYLALMAHSPGDVLAMQLRRDERMISAEMELQERPLPDGRRLARLMLGVSVEPFQVRSRDGSTQPAGLRVTEVERGGPAHRIGIEPGDLLVAVGRHPVMNLEDLGLVLEEIGSDQVVTVRVRQMPRPGVMYDRTGRLRTR